MSWGYVECRGCGGDTGSIMIVLTIETTCDETAAAVVNDSLEVLSSVVASQDALHEQYGGVVPEIAARAHVERLLPVIEQALQRAHVTPKDLAAIAVATTPGLAGSLIVGLTAAKTLCLALGKPLLAVNHLHAHIYACRMAAGTEVFPCVGLIVSGGHTSLYRCGSATDFQILGGTVDDAAGEAFDKVASMLQLPYPGGPAISRVARDGDPRAYRLPRPFLRDTSCLDFSFSGLKTAALKHIREKSLSVDSPALADFLAGFEEAVARALIRNLTAAADVCEPRSLILCGGVARNTRLRTRFHEYAARAGLPAFVPSPRLCTDNAAMIAGLALKKFEAGEIDGSALDLDAFAR